MITAKRVETTKILLKFLNIFFYLNGCLILEICLHEVVLSELFLYGNGTGKAFHLWQTFQQACKHFPLVEIKNRPEASHFIHENKSASMQRNLQNWNIFKPTITYKESLGSEGSFVGRGGFFHKLKHKLFAAGLKKRRQTFPRLRKKTPWGGAKKMFCISSSRIS